MCRKHLTKKETLNENPNPYISHLPSSPSSSSRVLPHFLPLHWLQLNKPRLPLSRPHDHNPHPGLHRAANLNRPHHTSQPAHNLPRLISHHELLLQPRAKLIDLRTRIPQTRELDYRVRRGNVERRGGDICCSGGGGGRGEEMYPRPCGEFEQIDPSCRDVLAYLAWFHAPGREDLQGNQMHLAQVGRCGLDFEARDVLHGLAEVGVALHAEVREQSNAWGRGFGEVVRCGEGCAEDGHRV